MSTRLLALLLCVTASPILAQHAYNRTGAFDPAVPTPQSVLGYEVGYCNCFLPRSHGGTGNYMIERDASLHSKKFESFEGTRRSSIPRAVLRDSVTPW